MAKSKSKQLVDKAKWLVKDYLLGVELPKRYAKAAKRPVEQGKVLFVEGKLESVPDAFGLLMPALERHPDLDVSFIALGQQVRGFKKYRKRCHKLVEEMATAQFVFLEDASDVVSCVDLRPETKVVQLWHACGAFKKWGMSVADLKFGNTAENIKRHPFYANLSLVTVSSPEVAWAYREAMMLDDTPEIVKPVGVSRTDVFFDAGFAAASSGWLRQKFPRIGDRKVIFYAPTFRGSSRKAEGPDALDFELLEKELGSEYALVVKHHPFVKHPPEIPPSCADFAFMAEAGDPVDSLLVSADVLITDYSSVVFEYALLSRPMIFFAPDIDDYNDWRGFYYDYDEMTPGPVVSTTEEVVSCIRSLGDGFDATVVEEFRDRFMSACDGHVTERLCSMVIGA